MKLDGKVTAEKVKKICKARIESLENVRPPRLAIIQAGDNPASNTYVKHKKNDCAEVGIETVVYRYNEDWTDYYQVSRVQQLIQNLNADKNVDGIMCQLPLEGLNDDYYQRHILDTIAPEKDVDGLRSDVYATINTTWYRGGAIPCTPHGVIMLLNDYGIDVKGMDTLVIGRSDLVTKPLAQLLIGMDAAVTVVHSKCSEELIRKKMRSSKLIISGVGKPGKWDVIQDTDLSKHPILVDIGTSKDLRSGKLVGDFAGFEFLDHFNDMDMVDYTPVPGGVGPMTRAALLMHVVDAWDHHLRKEGKTLCETTQLINRELRTEYERLRIR